MELNSAIGLIEKGIDVNVAAQSWADLGAGEGLFTKALASLLKHGSKVYAIDKNAKALKKISVEKHVTLVTMAQDFINEPIELKGLHGVLMANALHFVQDKAAFLNKLKRNLKEGGRLILIEYDTDHTNAWVPYPLSYKNLQKLAAELDFTYIDKLAMRSALYRKEGIYAALLKY